MRDGGVVFWLGLGRWVLESLVGVGEQVGTHPHMLYGGTRATMSMADLHGCTGR